VDPTDAVLLVGHGGVPRDFPRTDLMRLKALEAERRRGGGPVSDEEAALEQRIRTWPRTPANDPYRAGLERLAQHLAPRIAPARLCIAYNEFCAPTVAQAIAQLVAQGITRVVVVPSMLTPGGVHSEIEIPEALDTMRAHHPTLRIEYAWPFDLDAVASLLDAQVRLRASRARD
jgi:sirohydrochlorin cobaltochelatase